ncbi:NADH dehydrogenase [ubiquinone] 1 subunit C2 [Danaus plexippus]|uniref:NADH dehydrogenase [ubiquinone] 1 subunit C2 n=1 Tax=Danaus plexippus plexippus TaxID=278856 RepID=A0A212FLJ7_DANPL|nr:NADH dehydrogenase [ubiquinone] 1 subunit C2 [Danaus plexippus]OWR54570.1 NADH dehydrogenase [ubiquinone] 1 subunit C2 [Danaus plexippus plexippus]
MSSQMTALELLKLGDQGREAPVLNKYWPYILGAVFGVGTGITLNLCTRRPIWSGIQKHILGVAGWTATLNYAQNKRNAYYAEKDAVLRHYIELHPEDFPEPERKKIGDLLEDWIPIR